MHQNHFCMKKFLSFSGHSFGAYLNDHVQSTADTGKLDDVGLMGLLLDLKDP